MQLSAGCSKLSRAGEASFEAISHALSGVAAQEAAGRMAESIAHCSGFLAGEG